MEVLESLCGNIHFSASTFEPISTELPGVSAGTEFVSLVRAGIFNPQSLLDSSQDVLLNNYPEPGAAKSAGFSLTGIVFKFSPDK